MGFKILSIFFLRLFAATLGWISAGIIVPTARDYYGLAYNLAREVYRFD